MSGPGFDRAAEHDSSPILATPEDYPAPDHYDHGQPVWALADIEAFYAAHPDAD